jgi:hypothetical protein
MTKIELSDEAREAKNKYLREYRRRNPEKVKRYAAEHWERKAKQDTANAGDNHQ